jgi:NAD(P)-dependent dehydrogenase (short-subunit alcohol dehydrogenase family)
MSIDASFNLDKKVAIVTGASKGIGRAIAHSLGRHGAKVVICSRKQDAVDATAAEFISEGIDATGIAARIEHQEYLGESLLVHARVLDSGEQVICRLPPEKRRQVARGETVHLRPDPAKALLFDGDGRRLASRVLSLEDAQG